MMRRYFQKVHGRPPRIYRIFRSTCSSFSFEQSQTYTARQKKYLTHNESCNRFFGTSKYDRPISILNDKDILAEIPLQDIRNFCFIAHVDHGKSSLASRVLELTGNLGDEQHWTALETAGLSSLYKSRNDGSYPSSDDEMAAKKEQIELLDTLSVEKERGITVKASAASMLYPHPSAQGPHGVLLLNMVDTPGHADFGTEVTRTLSSVQGAVLLFDAAQGVQAQSLSVYEKANRIECLKTIVPVLTKVDLPAAKPLDVALSVSDLFGFDPDQVLLTSARKRKGIADILHMVCDKIPPPSPLPDDDDDDDRNILRAQVVDSWFEPLRGVVCLVHILSGRLSEGSRITVIEPHVEGERTNKDSSTKGHLYNSKEHYSVQDVGLLLPQRLRTSHLTRGQMGYVIVGLRDPRQAKPGTIMVLHKDISTVVNMYLPTQKAHTKHLSSVLYASVHPMEGGGFEELANAVERLALNDSGLEVTRTSGSSNTEGGPFLGPGLRVGFQGLLHVEVFQQRLFDEFEMEAIVTPPKVPYKITYHGSKKNNMIETTQTIEDISHWPSPGTKFSVQEPFVDIRIMAPMDYAGNIMDLIKRKRGTEMKSKPIDELTWLFESKMPWAEVVTDFHDELKNVTAGYASFDISESEIAFAQSNLAKVDIMLNGEMVEPLAFISHQESAQQQGRAVCKKLQEVLPRQQFVTIIQAKAGSKIIASERIKAYRKDVLTTGGSKAVGGGDITRKRKLLEKQKRGKKRQQSSGKVTLTQAAFNSVITRSS